jgi:nucleoredoxin
MSGGLGQVFVDSSGNQFGRERLDNKHVLLYFSASWCGPCRKFTPLLADFYSRQHSSRDFEVVFVSLDSEATAHTQYLSKMPWLSIPFEDQTRLRALESEYNCETIPMLVVLDTAGNKVAVDGVEQLRSDPSGDSFTLQ